MSTDWYFRKPHPYDSRPDWQATAACKGKDPDLFFPTRGTQPTKVREAKRVCAQCPIKQKCLDYALFHGERLGIWGGLSERERRALSVELRKTNQHPQTLLK